MSSKWNPGKLDTFKGRIQAFPEKLVVSGESAAVGAAEQGAQEMREVISSSGTGWESRAGRIDTGEMLEAVKAEGNRFGWLNSYREYFGIQDTGFVNVKKNAKNEGITWRTGTGGPPGFTVGMMARETARLIAQQWFLNEIKHLGKTVWRSL